MAINNNALASSQATVLSEDGNTLYATIQMRHGKEADMDKSKFVPAEMGVCTDTKKAVVAFAPNETKEIAFKEDLSNDYGDLENKPSIGGVELDGDKTLEQLGIQPKGNYLTEVPDGYVTDDDLEEQLADKLDKNQGTSNAGKMLVVGDDGNVQVGDEPVQVDPTLTKSGQAADALEAGHRIDRKAPAIVQDAFGYGGVITDSAEASFQGLKVCGASRQFTTTGAQLLDLSELTEKTSEGVTYTPVGDGTFKRTGTATTTSGNIWFLGGYSKDSTNEADVLFILPAGTYTVKDCLLFSNQTRYGNSNNGTFTIAEELKVTGVRNPSHTVGTTYNDVIYPMLNAGSTALPFEPYTGGKPAPNPDYTYDAEIPGSDGTVEIEVYGAQLIDYDKWSECLITNGTANYKDNGVILTSNKNGDCYTGYKESHKNLKIPVIEDEIYTLSWIHSGESGNVMIFPEGKVEGSVVTSAKNGKLSYTVPKGVKFITFRMGVQKANATATYKTSCLILVQPHIHSNPTNQNKPSPSRLQTA